MGWSNRIGSAWSMPATSKAKYIRARVKRDFGVGDVDCKVFINQRDSGGAGVHGQIATKENLACEEAEHWEEFTLSGEVLTSGINYILNIMGDGADLGPGHAYEIAYDEDGAVDSYFADGMISDYAAPESPWTQAAEGVTKDYSIYCNYYNTVAKINGILVTDLLFIK